MKCKTVFNFTYTLFNINFIDEDRPFSAQPQEEPYYVVEGDQGPTLACSFEERYRNRSQYEFFWTRVHDGVPEFVNLESPLMSILFQTSDAIRRKLLSTRLRPFRRRFVRKLQFEAEDGRLRRGQRAVLLRHFGSGARAEGGASCQSGRRRYAPLLVCPLPDPKAGAEEGQSIQDIACEVSRSWGPPRLITSLFTKSVLIDY
ncbi:hypothetical protein L596_003292 [Steinernema carpocapsae]|uniref:Uncharacterized protein n=1 Tax=Steinernema carpocapsae TaxID=34508 RepID=A0A4U8UST8_STECR|nr:hypothetical protein L596_003292 [Steinernema carpocapsae]